MGTNEWGLIRLTAQEIFDRKSHDLSTYEQMGNLYIDSFNDDTGVILWNGAEWSDSPNYDIVLAAESLLDEETPGVSDIIYLRGDNNTISLAGFTSIYMSEERPCSRIELYLGKSGSPSGNVWLEIYSNTVDYYPGTVLENGVSDSISTASISSAGYYSFTFSTPPILGGVTPTSYKYWIILRGDYTVDASNNIGWGWYTHDTDFFACTADISENWAAQFYRPNYKIYSVYSSGNVESSLFYIDKNIDSLLIIWEESLGTGSITVTASCNAGGDWFEVTNPLSYSSPRGTTKYKFMTDMFSGTSPRLEAVITGNAALKSWAIAW